MKQRLKTKLERYLNAKAMTKNITTKTGTITSINVELDSKGGLVVHYEISYDDRVIVAHENNVVIMLEDDVI